MATCTSCQAEIRWAVTAAGKLMPIDPEPVEGGNLELIGERNGRPLVRYRQPSLLEPPDGPRYRSHFASCPHAGQHRRARPTDVVTHRGGRL